MVFVRPAAPRQAYRGHPEFESGRNELKRLTFPRQVRDVEKIADLRDSIVGYSQRNKVARRQYDNTLATFQCRRDHPPALHVGVAGEVDSNFLASIAARGIRDFEPDVIYQHVAHCIPVAVIEELCVALNGGRDVNRTTVRRCRQRPDPGATPMQDGLDGRYAQIEAVGDSLQRIIQHVLQDDATALTGSELEESRHRQGDGLLAG